MVLAILKANIEHLKTLLDAEDDPRKRGPLERQLAEQELKLAASRRGANRTEITGIDAVIPLPPVARVEFDGCP